MSRKSKVDNAGKLINIVNTLIERNERLLQHIGDLEEYIAALEAINDFEEGEELISFIPDEEFQTALDEGLSAEQKERLAELKKSKEEKQSLHSMDDILSIFDEDDKDN
tara:strand:- start:1451 stop:1777 length:327 start_codon:yes stop_codon:yes gene_type:complete